MSDDKPNCIHHWIINVQNVGTCIKCEDVRDFALMKAQKKQAVADARAASMIQRNETKHHS